MATVGETFCIRLTGKGKKTRAVPIMKETTDIQKNYLSGNRLDMLEKHAVAAKKKTTVIPDKVSPHMFRHSKAMHLLHAGVNLIYIRDFLGHSHVDTTEIYAKADTEMKRAAIENVSLRIDENLPDWTQDKPLMSMLMDLSSST